MNTFVLVTFCHRGRVLKKPLNRGRVQFNSCYLEIHGFTRPWAPSVSGPGHSGTEHYSGDNVIKQGGSPQSNAESDRKGPG